MDQPDIEIVGDKPLTAGMRIAVRFRRDFTVTDPVGLLARAREAYLSLNPGVTQAEAAELVNCAADAIFTLLEYGGFLGDEADQKLAEHRDDGLLLGGWRAHVAFDDPWPLQPGPRADCLISHDVFALPPDGRSSPPAEAAR